MSSDRKPGKVRVVAAGAVQAPVPEAVPARRRTDRSAQANDAAAAAGAVQASSRLLWSLVCTILFLVSCLLGGALLVLSGIVGVGPA